MNALEACDEIEAAINELHEGSRKSDWILSYTEPLTDLGHIANMCDTFQKTRGHFGGPEKTEMWFVGTDENAILAACGNSPTAKARARYIAWVNPQNVLLLIARLRELEAVRGEFQTPGRGGDDVNGQA